MYDGKIKLPARIRQQLREDDRKGRLTKALYKLREHAALGGSDEHLQKYCKANRIVFDEDYLEILRSQTLDNCPFRFPTPRDYEILQNGSFLIGFIGPHGERLCQNPYDLHQGEGVVAAARMGKTWYLLRKAKHLHDLPDVGVFIADPKFDYLKLVHRDFKIILLKDLPFNPLELVPGTDIEAHCWEVGQQLGSAYCLHNSETVFSRILIEMFRMGRQPTLEEFRREVHKIRSGASTGLRLDQANALRGRIDQMCMVLGPKVCKVRYGFQPHKHDQDSIVFGLNLGDPATHGFFVTWLDWWLKTYNQAHGIRPNKLKTGIIVDESSYLLFSRREFPPYIDGLCALHPEFGVGLIAATQLSFSTAFQANTAHKGLLSEGDGKLFKKQAESMGLTHQQILWAERSLGGAGNAIVSTPKHGEPLLTALAPLKDEIPPATEEDIATSTKSLVEEIREYATERLRKAKYELVQKSQPAPPPKPVPGLVPGALALLRHSAEKTATPVTVAYKASNIESATKGNNAKKHLEDNELVKSEKCRFYRGRGRQPVFLEPTTKGIEYLKQHYPDFKPKLLNGRGSFEHRIHAHLVAKHYSSQDYIVRKEYCDADIGLEKPGTGKWIAIEIANGNSRNLKTRINSNKSAGAEKTIIITSEKKTANRLAKKLEKLKSIEVKDIEEFLLKRGELLK